MASDALRPRAIALSSPRGRVSNGGIIVDGPAGAVMALNGCAECLQRQREIDRLTEENERLKQQLRYQERQPMEGFFGSGTPSAKLPVKANTIPSKVSKPKGAQPGHPGAGR